MDFTNLALFWIAAIVTVPATLAASLLGRASDTRSLTLAFAVSLAVNIVLMQPWSAIGADVLATGSVDLLLLTLLGFVSGGIVAMTIVVLVRR